MLGRVYPLVVLLVFADVFMKASCISAEKGSLAFVIDDTLSMTDDINQVKKSVGQIMDIVFNEKASVISNMVLVTFNDPDAHVRAVTKDRKTFNKALSEVQVHNRNNPDCQEPSLNGLLLALKNSNRGSHIYVFTDASAKDFQHEIAVKQLCQEKQTQISFVITGRCTATYPDKYMKVYYSIAQACSGLAYEVEKDAVSEVLKPITDIISGEKIIITSTTVPAGVLKDIPFNIDEQTEYAIVSATGKDVVLKVTGPTDSKKQLLWKPNAKVLKLLNVKPGKYIATVKGASETSVVVVGRSDFLFKHGFSEQKPKSLKDTTLQPITNKGVYLSVLVTDERQSVEITKAQILGMNEKPIIPDLPLTKISKDFYVTPLLVTPAQMFKVAVIGKVKATGNIIKRIAKIPVTPSKPPKINDINLLDPVSDEFIAFLNSKQKFWKAGRNFPKNKPITELRKLLGALKDTKYFNLQKVDHVSTCINLPESFDPRTKWPNCPSLNEIRDQGQCGSCWAFGAVEAMTDRYCTYSNGKYNFHFSAQDLLSCCRNCQHEGCSKGGYPSLAWLYWQKCGIVSGGNNNHTLEGCKRYSLPFPNTCEKKCDSNSIDYATDKRRGERVYRIEPNEESIKAELYKNGPVEVSFDVYNSFFHYKNGVYVHYPQEKLVARHAVKMLGWGVENGVKYWLCANSWNSNWGEKGFFKILRGKNECKIEEEAIAGVPLYP
ncbi:unnamed protein product [Spodoptera littoralis]|uniref:Peptidase C1A papain C-terminal domain-containing protein n=1 Tax=Spodoptera littoralis TaxID=7109 RepID=A0A9P0HT46_SPOLI|nr:unnamed protein product [Spodoptera littoralis]CAH1634793.1 unnamed protein product [Spodoptera littoralis]